MDVSRWDAFSTTWSTYSFQHRHCQRVLQLNRMFMLGRQAIVDTDKNCLGLLGKRPTQHVFCLQITQDEATAMRVTSRGSGFVMLSATGV